jgi:hypothetical protein
LSTGTDRPAATEHTGASCPVDFTGSGSVSEEDIFDFLNAWFATDPRADFNHADGVSIEDIFDFLNAWFEGCR